MKAKSILPIFLFACCCAGVHGAEYRLHGTQTGLDKTLDTAFSQIMDAIGMKGVRMDALKEGEVPGKPIFSLKADDAVPDDGLFHAVAIFSYYCDMYDSARRFEYGEADTVRDIPSIEEGINARIPLFLHHAFKKDLAAYLSGCAEFQIHPVRITPGYHVRCLEDEGRDTGDWVGVYEAGADPSKDTPILIYNAAQDELLIRICVKDTRKRNSGWVIYTQVPAEPTATYYGYVCRSSRWERIKKAHGPLSPEDVEKWLDLTMQLSHSDDFCKLRPTATGGVYQCVDRGTDLSINRGYPPIKTYKQEATDRLTPVLPEPAPADQAPALPDFGEQPDWPQD